MNEAAVLHGYFRSSAAWRVRIALNLKGVPAHLVSHHLRHGQQQAPAYLALNPQGLVPTLELPGGAALTQSIAIVEWLEETHPNPALLPNDPLARARVRAFAMAITSDTHPLTNLKVLRRLRAAGLDEAAVNEWGRAAMADGLAAAAALLAGQDGPFCFGAAPGLADICLVPLLAGARRFGLDPAAHPALAAREAACQALPAFAAAAPERQPDAE